MDNGQWTMGKDYVTPLQGFADGVIPDPGRCPGLVCRAPSGLIPASPIRLTSCPCPVRVKSVSRPCKVRVKSVWVVGVSPRQVRSCISLLKKLSDSQLS
jgi:hypothetical protein